MEALVSLVIVSFIGEAIVNLVDNIKEKETSWKYWVSLVFGILISVVITYNWSVDIFEAIGLAPGKFAFVGPILTGLLISRGSNVISDVVARINGGGNQ